MNKANCRFCRIAQGRTTEALLYEDRDFVAFSDHEPRAPIHILIVPKSHIESFLDLDEETGTKLFAVARELISKLQIVDETITFGFHVGKNRSVEHVHAHLLAAMGDKLVL